MILAMPDDKSSISDKDSSKELIRHKSKESVSSVTNVSSTGRRAAAANERTSSSGSCSLQSAFDKCRNRAQM
jgi:hypothetical protein